MPISACPSIVHIHVLDWIRFHVTANKQLFSSFPLIFSVFFYLQMMAHNTTVQLGGTAFLVCKVAGVDRVGVNWVFVFGVFPLDVLIQWYCIRFHACNVTWVLITYSCDLPKTCAYVVPEYLRKFDLFITFYGFIHLSVLIYFENATAWNLSHAKYFNPGGLAGKISYRFWILQKIMKLMMPRIECRSLDFIENISNFFIE